MNEESLSALLDGECTPSELEAVLRQLDREPALRQRFDRLARAREAVRGTRMRRLPADFADRVMARLDGEPVAAAPERPVWRPLAGLALAAAVATVAVLALRPDRDLAPGAMPAATPAAAAGLTAQPDAAQARLRDYLIAYSQSRAQQGIGGGTLGYARFAAHTEFRPQDIAR